MFSSHLPSILLHSWETSGVIHTIHVLYVLFLGCCIHFTEVPFLPNNLWHLECRGEIFPARRGNNIGDKLHPIQNVISIVQLGKKVITEPLKWWCTCAAPLISVLLAHPWRLLDLRKNGLRETNGGWGHKILMLSMSRRLISPPRSPSPMSSLSFLSHCTVAGWWPHPPQVFQRLYGEEVSHQGTSNSYNCFLRAKCGSLSGTSACHCTHCLDTLAIVSHVKSVLCGGIKQQAVHWDRKAFFLSKRQWGAPPHPILWG